MDLEVGSQEGYFHKFAAVRPDISQSLILPGVGRRDREVNRVSLDARSSPFVVWTLGPTILATDYRRNLLSTK